MAEYWKPIKDFESYQVSTLGRIKSFIGREKILKLVINRGGYLSVKLNGRRFSVHRIVAITFIDNPENKATVNHKNKVRTDNRVENLEWNTFYENFEHKIQYSLSVFSASIKEQINILVPL